MEKLEKLMTETDVIKFLEKYNIPISKFQLRRMRTKGYGGTTPRVPHVHANGRARYRPSDVEKWVKEVKP